MSRKYLDPWHLTRVEARDLWYAAEAALEKEGLQPNVEKNLKEAQSKLQAFVWPGLCGPFGCSGEHGADECNNIKCSTCATEWTHCKCVGGPVLERIR